MKKLLLFALAQLAAFCAMAQLPWHPKDDRNWEIVFQDEFNKVYFDSERGYNVNVDPKKWYDRVGWNQGERGVYAFENTPSRPGIPYFTWHFRNIIKPSDTTIVMRAQKEAQPYFGEIWYWDSCRTCQNDIDNQRPNVTFDPNTQKYKVKYGDTTDCYWVEAKQSYECFNHPLREYTHTSGMMVSKNQFKFGVFEMKFRIPTGGPEVPVGPNFWLWNSNDNPFLYSEIDIFEIDGTRNNMHGSNVHIVYENAPGETFKYDLGFRGDTYKYNDQTRLDNSWHTSTCIWDGDYVAIYVDGVLHQGFAPYGSKMGPMQMIIDLLYPPIQYLGAASDISKVPPTYDYEIDYVRVYQPKNKCNESVQYCNFPGDIIVGKYQGIEVGGVNCTYSIPANTNYNYIANEEILLNKGFESGVNTIFSAAVVNGGCSVFRPNLMAPVTENQNKISTDIGLFKTLDK